MECLADTIAIIRYFSELEPLGRKAKEVLEGADKGENVIWISIISVVEIMYLAEKNRIPLDLEELMEVLEKTNNYIVVDLDLEIVNVASKISGMDLHDRLIVATAKYLEVPIISNDKVIRNSGIIDIIWD